MHRSGTIKKKEVIFFFAYSGYLVFSLLSTTLFFINIVSIYNYLVAMFLFLLAVNEVACEKQSKRSICFAVIIAILCISIFHSAEKREIINFVTTLVFVYCARGMNYKSIAKTTIVIDMMVLFTVIVSSQVGIVENYVFDISIRSRECLGFQYTLYPATILGNVLLLELFLHKNNLPWKKIIPYAILVYWMYQKTNARLTTAISFCCILIGITTKITHGKIVRTRLIQVLNCLSYPVCATISIYFAYTYKASGWELRLNTLLGQRLRLMREAVSNYGVSLFGQEIQWIGSGLDYHGQLSTLEYNYVDNIYIKLLVQFGILFFVFYIIGFTVLQIVLCKRNMHCLALIISILAAHGLIDDLTLWLYFNTFWLALGQIMVRSSKSQIERSQRHLRMQFIEAG